MKKSGYLDVFLKSLSNHELVLFVHYRMDGFILDSKERILNELNHRNIHENQKMQFLERPIHKHKPDDTRFCTRCGSTRFDTETDYEYRMAGRYSTKKMALDTRRCQICGYNPEKEIPKSFFARLKKTFQLWLKEREVSRYKSF